MVLSTTGVSIVLLTIWAIMYRLLRKRLGTSKFYFLLLVLMGSAGLLLHPLPIVGGDLTPMYFHLSNIVLFSFLMMIVLLPWLKVDRYLKNKNQFIINEKYIDTLKVVFTTIIILSITAMVYFAPYFVRGTLMNSNELRSILGEESLLPQSIWTTLGVGICELLPIDILLVYISLLDKRLRKYTIWLVLSSLGYIFYSAAEAARDGYIFMPIMYIIFFLFFKKSLSNDSVKLLKRWAFIGTILLLVGIGGITVGRFYYTGQSSHEAFSSLIGGTWGYFYQQPYVFDHVLDYHTSFFGFKRRLSFLDPVFNLGGVEYSTQTADSITWMFGTQFSDFYQMGGYTGLFIALVVFLLMFMFFIRINMNKGRLFPLLVAFCIYVYFTISGLFYFRFGGNDSEFFFLMAILISSLFIPNVLEIKRRTL